LWARAKQAIGGKAAAGNAAEWCQAPGGGLKAWKMPGHPTLWRAAGLALTYGLPAAGSFD